MRLDPPIPDTQGRAEEQDWGYHGIVAYSKICTHVGCPVGLYEQQTHHLLCPCHQSTFDVTNDGKVIFGPANRPLPQLPITVDAEGYLVAPHDFTEAGRPELLGALDEHLRPAAPASTTAEAGSRPAAARRSAGSPNCLDDRTGRRLHDVPAQESSRTTGRSCSARSRCTR